MAIEYFQSALFASEMDAAWLNSVRYDKDQDLSEAEKAQARNNLGAAAFGSILKILGHYNTVEVLQANGEQKTGNAYSVGTVVPYKLYIFDGSTESWLDYGYIRSQDINARCVQNVAIAKSAWEQDADVLAGYTYKAKITLSDSTVDSFPIVVFESEQAFSGNFAPMSFAFAGYLEIFAKSIPTKDINIATATVIVGGGVGKGITNASADIADKSIGTNKLVDGSVTAVKIANEAVSKVFSTSIPVNWNGSEAPFSAQISIDGVSASDVPIVDLIPSSDYETAQQEIEAWGYIYRVETKNNGVTCYATEKPEVVLNIQMRCIRK